MNTREQAALLRRYADFLDSIGEFKIDAIFVASNNGTVSQHFYDKAEFTPMPEYRWVDPRGEKQ